jgi:hypothetical protein
MNFILSALVCLAALLVATQAVSLDGKYTFVSQEDFLDYLKAADVGLIYRNVLNDQKPDFIVESDGATKFTLTNIAPTKIYKFSFTLGEPTTTDILTDRNKRVVN